MHVTKNIFLIFCCLLFLSRAHSLRAAEHYQAVDSDIDQKTLYLSAFTSGVVIGFLACQSTKHLWQAKDPQAPKKMFFIGCIAVSVATGLTLPLYFVFKNKS